MEIGSKVKVSGTSLQGIIIACEPRRLPDRPALISFYTVQFPDGSTQEYGREELRYVDKSALKK